MIQAKVVLGHTSHENRKEVWLNFAALPREGETLFYDAMFHVVDVVCHEQQDGSAALLPVLHTLKKW